MRPVLESVENFGNHNLREILKNRISPEKNEQINYGTRRDINFEVLKGTVDA